ncbi:MAG: Hsp70 family protein [Chloroflexi bacterium]|nr:Hsp70 family protein [Chloroflexota bacterium]
MIEHVPGPEVRIGVDFGTSTTQVAVRVDRGEPTLVPLEAGTDWMPSYAGKLDDRWLFGSEAMNLPVSVHSLKPRLADDQPVAEFPDYRPSDIVEKFLVEVATRTLRFLANQRLIDASVDRLTIATQLGCTSRFDLATRLRLRDVAREAGFEVNLPDLMEEPVAAAFEISYGGVVRGDRVMIIDIGGGTTDVAVVRGDLGSKRYELYATRGTQLAGDRFTDLIVEELRREVLRQGGREQLDRQSATALWARAESAKLGLSDRRSVVVPLGGIGGGSGEVQLTKDWFTKASGPLMVQLKHDIREAFLVARLVLDRGGPDDPEPGTLTFRKDRRGGLVRLTDLTLAEDAREHLDAVVAVGGASRTPAIQNLLNAEFGTLLQDPYVDPVSAVALGLARGERLDSSNLRYPSWEIAAVFDQPEKDRERALYSPYAPTLSLQGGQTASCRTTAGIPVGARQVRLAFRPIPLTSEPVLWPATPLPAGATSLQFSLNLLGQVRLEAVGSGLRQDLIAGDSTLRAPWSPIEGKGAPSWLQPARSADWYSHLPMWDWREVG